jgi:cytochrome P450
MGLPEWFPRSQAPEIRRAVRRVKGTLDGIIDALRASHRAGDPSVIGMLLDATDQDGAPLDQAAIRNEAAVIFMAGHETTANCLAWTWYLLSQVPSVEARLHAELDEVLGGRAPTQGDLPRLIYTRAIIDEALRLYPPVPVLARETTGAETLRRRDVPVGSIVMVAPWLLHRHRKYWDDPDHFRPERFLPDAPAPDKYVYVPFSVGPRVCAGLTFGLSEAILCLATLAQEFSLTLKPGATVEPICRLTLRPGDTLPMTLRLRRA